jgi:hypothetical protein
MAYIVYKQVKGRYYAYLQQSYRVPGRRTPKTETVYLGRVGGPGTAAGLKEHQEFTKLMAERNNMEADIWRMRHAADIRERQYKVSRPSPEFRAKSEHNKLRDQNQKEIRGYWQKVEEQSERDRQANEAYRAEQASADAAQHPSSQSDQAPDE